MTDYVTDTHALIWYLQDSDKLGREADIAFEACDRGEVTIVIPTLCLIELIYLQEKGRIPRELKKTLDEHLALGLTNFVTADLTPAVVSALETIPRDLVPDLPDRVIAATAKALNLPLLSRDRALQRSGLNVVW
ncbi:MAG: type II toxin-antitoxin system VapC family toxin [Candidatus Promineofilum sp.]|nr:type II toxin-antitoxin system VapC family toxin [Promineifilum sp.]